MKRPWAALGLVLALSVIMPRHAEAQAKPTKPVLKQNYPNPFNPETSAPFLVGGFPNCSEPNKQYNVSLTVYNVIGQVVAIPVLKGAADGVSGGTPLDHVLLRCGSYIAFWNGKIRSNGREAASGIYQAVMNQDGEISIIRMIVAK